MVSDFGVRNRKLPLPCLCESLSAFAVVSATCDVEMFLMPARCYESPEMNSRLSHWITLL
jgi:hypothetical protein